MCVSGFRCIMNGGGGARSSRGVKVDVSLLRKERVDRLFDDRRDRRFEDRRDRRLEMLRRARGMVSLYDFMFQKKV